MLYPTPERRAIDLADKFMEMEFDDEAEASAWLVMHVDAAIHEAEADAVEMYRRVSSREP